VGKTHAKVRETVRLAGLVSIHLGNVWDQLSFDGKRISCSPSNSTISRWVSP